MHFDFWQLILILGIPSAVTGFCVWTLKKHIDKKEHAKQDKDVATKNFTLLLLQGTMASLSLGEATARAVQRLPDTHCNGDMKTALSSATSTKAAIRDFLTEQGVENLKE